MLIYFIKSSFLFLIFYVIYIKALEQKKSSFFKRYYLLSSLALAITLPLFTFSFRIAPNEITAVKEYATTYISELPPILTETSEDSFSLVLWLYGIITFGFALRFIYQIYVIKRIKKEEIDHPEFGKIALHQNKFSPFSFLNTIYIQKEKWEHNEIGTEILFHEKAHVTQKHSLDILMVEFLKIFFWFQPFFYIYKKKMEQNHEYLADEYALSQTENIKGYQRSILHYYECRTEHVSLASSFYFNNLKKRFIMMKMSKKANVKEVLAYSSTALLMYAGLVGIDAKAAEIEKIESHIENTVKSLYPSSKEKDTIKISEEEKGLETPFTKKGNVTQIISYVKGKRIDGYINFNEGIHYYIVDENAHLEIYDRYGIKQNTNDLNIKLVEIEKEEKERTNGRQAQFQQEVDEKASPKEGMQNFFKKFVSTFHLPEQYKDKAEIKMVLRFIVNENGTLSDIKAHNSENKDYVLHERDINKPNDSYYFEGLKAAILTLKQMPEWNPAMKGEKAVASNFTIPLTLKTGNPETSKDIYSNVEFDKKASPKEGLQKFYENVTDVMDLSELAANTRFTIEFVVETDGSLSDIRLKPSTALSKELSDKYQLLLTDAIRKTPKWIPAEKDGKPVRSDFVLPVSFEKINK